MAFIQSASQSLERMKGYKTKVRELLDEYHVTNPKTLVSIARANEDFRERWKALFKEFARQEGGKLSLSTIGMIVGLSLGGIGIGGFFGAFGVPLALVLGGFGLFTGQEIDDVRISKVPTTKVKIPTTLFERIQCLAEKSGRDPEVVIVTTLEVAFSEGDVATEANS